MSPMAKLCIFIIVISLLLSCPASLNAGEDFHQSLDSYFQFIPSRGVRAMSGEIEIFSAGSEYSYTFKALDKLPVKFSLDNNYIGIDNTTGVELPAHLVGLSTDIETTLPFFKYDKAYLHLGASPSFYGDDWNFPASSFRIPMRAYLVYLAGEQWTFLAGLAVYPDFENELLPILGLVYKPNDRLTFNLIPKRPNVSYSLNERVTLFAEGGGAFNSEFEVAKDDLKNVVLRYREMHLAAGIRYKINNFIQTSLAAGGMFNRSLKYRDSLGKVNIKDAAFVEARAELKI